MDGSLIHRDDCLVPYSRSNGEDATLDLSSMKPGDFFDPASKWPILTPKVQKGAIPISWLFFKGDMLQNPTPLHPFDGPWQKVYKVTFAVDLLSMNSSTIHRVMGPVDVNDYFWESLVQRNGTSPYQLNVNGFQNMSCTYYEFGAATYWWTPSKDIDQKQTYQLRLRSNDTVGWSGNDTNGLFISGGFQLGGGENMGTPAQVGGSLAIVIVIFMIIGGLYFLWQRRQKYRPWILDQIYGE